MIDCQYTLCPSRFSTTCDPIRTALAPFSLYTMLARKAISENHAENEQSYLDTVTDYDFPRTRTWSITINIKYLVIKINKMKLK